MKRKQWMVLLLSTGMLYLTTGCFTVRFFLDPQPVVKFQENDYREPAKIVDGRAQLYLPDPSQVDLDDDLKLLLTQAPIIVQGMQPQDKKKYEQEADWIGHPAMGVDDKGKPQVEIDTGRPTLFCRIEKALVEGKELTQLAYVFWYPRHPVGGIQKGHIDGGAFRVTLDAGGRPATYEHSQTCGCYHGILLGEHVEAWAQKSFGQLDKGKKRFVEKKVKGRINWVVRDIVPGTQTKARPVLFMEAGTHRCAAIQTAHIMKGWTNLPERTYQVKRYETLERLPTQGKPGKTASIFNEDGLVWGGRRIGEEIVFLTMDHPGWPRHLDKIMMHWDEVNWIDPSLLETYLRLPKQVLDERAEPLR